MKHYNTVEEFNADGFTPRLFTMPADEYRKIDAVSQSEIKNYLKSPAYWQAIKEQPQPATDAMILGSYFDALLTGDGAEKFMVKTWDNRTNAGKALTAEHEAAGRVVVSENDAAKIARWVVSIKAHPDAAKYLTLTPQVCVIGMINGVLCKGRADLFDAETKSIADLKLVADASPEAIAKNLESYDLQAAMYSELFSQVLECSYLDMRFVLLCQEKHEFSPTPNFTGIYEIAQPDIISALTQIKKTVKDIESAKAFGAVGYSTQTITARWPRSLK